MFLWRNQLELKSYQITNNVEKLIYLVFRLIGNFFSLKKLGINWFWYCIHSLVVYCFKRVNVFWYWQLFKRIKIEYYKLKNSGNKMLILLLKLFVPIASLIRLQSLLEEARPPWTICVKKNLPILITNVLYFWVPFSFDCNNLGCGSKIKYGLIQNKNLLKSSFLTTRIIRNWMTFLISVLMQTVISK